MDCADQNSLNHRKAPKEILKKARLLSGKSHAMRNEGTGEGWVPLQIVKGSLRFGSVLGSAELKKHWPQTGRERGIRVLQFGDQAASCSSEGPT